MRRVGLMILLCAVLVTGTTQKAGAAEFTQRELACMPATLQIELFKRGVISPVDVLQAQKGEYDRTEEKVNAVTVAHWDNALKMAKDSARHYADGSFRVLEGVTVGIKDEHYDAGWVITRGSLVHKNDAPEDHTDAFSKGGPKLFSGELFPQVRRGRVESREFLTQARGRAGESQCR